MTRWLSILCLGACTQAPAVGPPTVDALSHRFVVDRILLPTTTTQARTFGDDLTGDFTIDNQLGQAISALAGQDDANTHGADMIASGRIAMFAYVRDDGTNGAVWLFGDDTADATVAAGASTGGKIVSGRLRDGDATGDATVVLPIFADADPSRIDLHGLQIEATPDGNGGFDALIQGVMTDDIATIAAQGLAQMIDADVRDHILAFDFFDENGDRTVSLSELENNSLLKSLLAPDMHFDGKAGLSFGFSAHLTPCDAGTCSTPVASCFDRVTDGTEADVDCGGDCAIACGPGAACASGDDCQSGACDAGHCAEPTCTDGRVDGVEGDVDCGGGCATKCAHGQGCLAASDCVSGACSSCDASTGICSGPGTCM